MAAFMNFSMGLLLFLKLCLSKNVSNRENSSKYIMFKYLFMLHCTVIKILPILLKKSHWY